MGSGHPLNPDRVKQVINFDGLQFERGITPTDIDGGFDLDGETFVFFEMKYRKSVMPKGQALFLTRIVDGLWMAGKDAVLFVCSHDVDDPAEQIMANDLRVEKVYYEGRMMPASGNLHDAVQSFLDMSRKRREL